MNISLIQDQDTFSWNNWTFPTAFFNTSIPLHVLLNSSDLYDMSQYLNNSLRNLSQQLMMDINEDDLYKLLSKTEVRPQRDALPLVITITVFYALIFIAGILGNLITCIVISRNKFMHTATNFYLFNLAISDMILLVSGMPPDLYNIWYPISYPFTDPICILESILCETAANATVLTITAFTVERYIAICHPFRQHTMSKLSRAIKFILAIWLAAFILAMPQAIQFSVIDEKGGKLCSVKNNYIGHVFAVSGFVFFVGPMTAICVLYVLIGVKLKKSKLLHSVKRKGCDINNRGMSAQTRIIRMLVAVAVAFFLCWAPFHAQRLMAVYGSTVESTSILFEDIYTILTYTSGVLYFLSTCINPLLYNIMSYKFRDAFKITLARQFGLTDNYHLQNHNYSALARQNGSIRLTTVTNRANNCSLAELHQRESDISLQDGLRPNRINRFRCISIGSQSTLLTASSKNDVFATHPTARCEMISAIDDNSISDSQRIQEIPLLRKHCRNSTQNSTKDLLSGDVGSGSSNERNSNIRNNSSDNEATTSLSSTPCRSKEHFSYSRNNSDQSIGNINLPILLHQRHHLRHQNYLHHNHYKNSNMNKKKNGYFTETALTTNDTKLSALENLSQKLRNGTKKVLLRSNNLSELSNITTATTTTIITPSSPVTTNTLLSKHQLSTNNSQRKQEDKT